MSEDRPVKLEGIPVSTAQPASQLGTALAGGTLEHTMVKAIDGPVTYAGAAIEHSKIW